MTPKEAQSTSYDIVVVGAGYVGLVAAACFADLGFRVCVIDRNPDKIERLQHGVIPFFEPGLDLVVKRTIARKRLFFSPSLESVVPHAKIVMIAVGTPSQPNGKVDTHDYWKVIDAIAPLMHATALIVDKSTVPIGTAQKAMKRIARIAKKSIDVVSFPEFLREGTALDDFLKPDRLVVGAPSKKSERIMKRLIRGIRTKKIFTSLETAEMIKYASNAFLATKISFINEIANICESTGADVVDVALGMGLDKRIGTSFLRAGIGYGGSCFPKDVKALKHIAGSNHYSFKLLKSVIEVNSFQRKYFVEKIERHFRSLKGKTIAVLGLAFKGNTDDVRESASIDIINELLRKGAKVVAHDPVAETNARKVLPVTPKLIYCQTIEHAVKQADATVIATEWRTFSDANWKTLKKKMKSSLVFDGRNILDKQKMKELGFDYYSIGR